MNRSLLNRCVAVSSLVAFAVVIGMTVAALPAKAAVYTDALYDENGGGDSSDISTVAVTNDATNLTFNITLNDYANIGPTANHYGKYEVGIQVNGGAGGQTLINTSGYGPGNPAYGNPYGNDVGISTGENFWIGTFLDDPTPYAGGAPAFFLFVRHGVVGIHECADHGGLRAIDTRAGGLDRLLVSPFRFWTKPWRLFQI